jgi:hypothetical protein
VHRGCEAAYPISNQSIQLTLKQGEKVRAHKKKSFLKYTSLSCDLNPLDLCLWGHLKSVEAAIQNEDTRQRQQL